MASPLRFLAGLALSTSTRPALSARGREVRLPPKKDEKVLSTKGPCISPLKGPLKGTYPYLHLYFKTQLPTPPNVPTLRALWSLLDGIWGFLKGSWGVLDETSRDLKIISNFCYV